MGPWNFCVMWINRVQNILGDIRSKIKIYKNKEIKKKDEFHDNSKTPEEEEALVDEHISIE